MSNDNAVVDMLKRAVSLLESIHRVLQIQARPALRGEVEKLASTSERRKMWILSDGLLRTEEIAKRAGAKSRTVQLFAQQCKRAGLMISERRGYPRRAIDLIPDDWEEVKELEKALAELQAEETVAPGGNQTGPVHHESLAVSPSERGGSNGRES